MGHNKWFVACLVCLIIAAIPGGMSIMWGVLVCIGFSGVCFLKWLYEEDKEQKKRKCGQELISCLLSIVAAAARGRNIIAHTMQVCQEKK